MEKSWELKISGDSKDGNLYVVGTRLVSKEEKQKIERLESGDPRLFQGGTPIPMPSFWESVDKSLERTKKTLEHIKKEEKSQGLSWVQISQKRASEQAKERQKTEQAHEELSEANRRTRQNIADLELQKKLEAIREQREYFEKCLAEIRDIDVAKIRERWQKRYYEGL